MECNQLKTSGMSGCPDEFIDRSDMTVIRYFREYLQLMVVCVYSTKHVECIGFDVTKLQYKTLIYAIVSKISFHVNTKFTLLGIQHPQTQLLPQFGKSGCTRWVVLTILVISDRKQMRCSSYRL